jgi:hypothetical protein
MRTIGGLVERPIVLTDDQLRVKRTNVISQKEREKRNKVNKRRKKNKAARKARKR